MSEQPIRVFVAIELGDEVAQALAQAQAALRQTLHFSTFRWTAPDGIHLTLKFLGDVLPSRLPQIEQALAQVTPNHPMFDLTVTGLGVFPNATRPAVLWVGLEGQVMQLQRLRDDVERVIAPLGYPTEKRAFHPHLTLARIKEPSQAEVQRLQEVIRRDPVGLVGEIGVAELSLMRSNLAAGGARYTRLAQFELGE
jgi:RNA 2',3'-cyclic 3'-phosphodiesterase